MSNDLPLNYQRLEMALQAPAEARSWTARRTAVDEQVEWLYERGHRGRWLVQRRGPFGPGSCFCCADGGPFAGKAPPLGVEPEPEIEITDPYLLRCLRENGL